MEHRDKQNENYGSNDDHDLHVLVTTRILWGPDRTAFTQRSGRPQRTGGSFIPAESSV